MVGCMEMVALACSCLDPKKKKRPAMTEVSHMTSCFHSCWFVGNMKKAEEFRTVVTIAHVQRSRVVHHMLNVSSGYIRVDTSVALDGEVKRPCHILRYRHVRAPVQSLLCSPGVCQTSGHLQHGEEEQLIPLPPCSPLPVLFKIILLPGFQCGSIVPAAVQVRTSGGHLPAIPVLHLLLSSTSSTTTVLLLLPSCSHLVFIPWPM